MSFNFVVGQPHDILIGFPLNFPAPLQLHNYGRTSGNLSLLLSAIFSIASDFSAKWPIFVAGVPNFILTFGCIPGGPRLVSPNQSDYYKVFYSIPHYLYLRVHGTSPRVLFQVRRGWYKTDQDNVSRQLRGER